MVDECEPVHFTTDITEYARGSYTGKGIGGQVDMACGNAFRYFVGIETITTKDPREVTCEKCKTGMKDYAKNMMLSLLMQDYGTNKCANRFLYR